MNLVRNRGFTIVELLIVVVVIAILAAITVVAYNGITKQANDSALASSLQQAAKKVVVEFTMKSDTYPASLAAVGINNSGDTTYQYVVNTASPVPNYCITITKGSGSNAKIGHIAGAKNAVNQAVPNVPCNDHQTTATRTITAATITNTALNCPTGYIAVPGNSLFDQKSFCVMKYEAKNVGNVPTSQAAGTPWLSISQTSTISTIQSTLGGDYGLISDNQWLTIAHNTMTQPSNWIGGVVGTGSMYRGHTDSAPASSLAAATNDSDGYNGTEQTTGEQRRTLTLSSGAVIWDLAGNVYEWTQTTTEGAGKQPGLATDAGYITWRQWSLPGLAYGGFASSAPAYGNSTASGWSSTQNIGQLISNASDDGLRAALRGGGWSNGSFVGVMTLLLNNSPAGAGTNIGFRVAR